MDNHSYFQSKKSMTEALAMAVLNARTAVRQTQPDCVTISIRRDVRIFKNKKIPKRHLFEASVFVGRHERGYLMQRKEYTDIFLFDSDDRVLEKAVVEFAETWNPRWTEDRHGRGWGAREQPARPRGRPWAVREGASFLPGE